MSITTVTDPGHREALWELEAGFEQGALVTLFGPCRVAYDGRAASSLPVGRRLVVLKPDGTALVHTDEGREPVNWQPPGSRHRATIREGRLVVRSVRSSPDEELRVVFDRVERLAAYPVTGERDAAVVGTEADLRRQVMADPGLIEAGFEPTATERETAAGAVDVFGHDEAGRPVAVELKRRRVGPDAVGQLARYVAALEREQSDGEDAGGPRGILVAPSVTDRAAELLAEEGLTHVALDPPEESFDSTDDLESTGERETGEGEAGEGEGGGREADPNGRGESVESERGDTPAIVSDPGAGARTEADDGFADDGGADDEE